MRPWRVAYTEAALRFISRNVTSVKTAERIYRYEKLLEQMPDFGVPYDPYYDAAMPPFPCRQVRIPDTPFTMYYLKDEESRRIVIFSIAFSRADPRTRFRGIEW